MEARFGEKPHHYYGPVVSDLKAVGKRTMEWDLNDWRWDADLFTATPSENRSKQLFPVTSDLQTNTGASNSSSSCSVEINLQNQNEKRELEKKRRVTVLDEEEVCGDAGALNLKLGGQVYPITEDEAERWEGKNGKKTKVAGATSNRAVCQVDDCRTDLSNAKDYHRRHKVCDLHSKATKALVMNVMQRFCQQCSRFHALQEFDEGKRSCRRRLAGHNRRRRKTHPENTANGVSLNDENGSNYLLISLLRILTNRHSNNSDQRNDQDLLTHLLKNLANLAGNLNENNLSGLITGSQNITNAGTAITTIGKEPLESETMHNGGLQIQDPSSQTTNNNIPSKSSLTVGRMKLNNIDLNNAYDDSQDCMETMENFDTPENTDNVPIWLRGDPHKSSPPQTSGNSGTTATQSPSSSSGEAQSRTDRIVFKLFGKEPNELPVLLRNQILNWLSQSPTDIEGYIKPGCIILSVYLRMDNSSWDELCYDLSSNLRKLLEASNDSFWRTGWIYTRVLDHVAFACNGQIVVNTCLPHKGNKNSTILTIKPIAVSVSETTQFSVKGFNFSWSTSRLTCALEGSYLIQTNCSDVMDGVDSSIKHDNLHSLTFSCSVPNIHGRGFIEIEDDSLSSSFFPFIVAEENVCSEIRTLETDIDKTETCEARNQALEFINEMGWLLHRSHLKSRLSSMDPNSDLFSFDRFRWLMEFSVDHDWCHVVNKLLTLIFNGTVDIDTLHHTSIVSALLDIGLLHRAVRRNSRIMVEFLLNFSGPGPRPVLFKPDAVGPAGLTPLHIAAGKDGSEHVLDALTNDPQMVGIEAWRTCEDSSGLTPCDYASLRGHYPYIHLVQRKVNKKKGHVVVDIPVKTKARGAELSLKGFEMEKALVFKGRCNECEGKLVYFGGGRSSLAIYKPAMLSMVAIAAVCVCVALLFKSSPQVMYVFQPFIWERLKYGAS